MKKMSRSNMFSLTDKTQRGTALGTDTHKQFWLPWLNLLAVMSGREDRDDGYHAAGAARGDVRGENVRP